jgi:putative redox protein
MMTAPALRVSFDGSQGGLLSARLDLPAAPAVAYALFAHCFTCSKDVVAASRVAAGLTRHGIGVLRFDFTGLGSSDGEFAHTNFSSNLDDLRRAAAWLTEHHCAPQLLVGHSLGGAAVLAVAADLPSVQAVATIGAPSDVRHVERLLGDQLPLIESHGEAEVQLAGRSFKICRQFVEDLRSVPLAERVAALHRALLILHSPVDQIVGIDHAAAIFGAARHPKSFVAVDAADHLLTRRTDSDFAASVIGSWAHRYLHDESGAAPAPAPTAQAVVAETTQGPYLNHVVVGSHQFLVDEPESIGGFDAGPAPYDLLSSALGACTSMTLRMYANRKKLPLDRVSVEVQHGKVHADDCAECAEGRVGLIDRFERVVHLTGDLTDEQRAALLAIANKCPVHRTLEASSVISTRLGD